MKIQVFVALAKHGGEVLLLGVNQNSRLVEIQRDSFMMKPDHIDWEAQTQTHELQIEWKEKKNETVSEEETISEQRKDIHAEVSRKIEE